MEEKKELELTFKWQNGSYFELKCKPDSGDKFTVVYADENNTIAAIWARIDGIVTDFVTLQMNKIGEEMKG